MTDQEKQLNAKRRSLYTRVLAATDWPAIREFAASRIEMHRNTLEKCSPEDLPKIQGQIEELRYLSRADEDIRTRLAHLPKDAAE